MELASNVVAVLDSVVQGTWRPARTYSYSQSSWIAVASANNYMAVFWGTATVRFLKIRLNANMQMARVKVAACEVEPVEPAWAQQIPTGGGVL